MENNNLADRRKDRDQLVQALLEAGATVKGSQVKCPFHDDRTPSGGIHQDGTGSWRFTCHTSSCSVSGDVWDIEARALGVSTTEHLRNVQKTSSDSVKDSKPLTFMSQYALEHFIERKIGPLEFGPFEYRNPDTGAVDLLVYRIEKPFSGGKKRFVQAHQSGAAWVLKAPPKPWPLYRRDEIKNADLVVVCEGEKAVEALRVFGFAATTSPAGAGSAEHADWSVLAGKNVILWPDNDDPGRKHMADVERILGKLDPPAHVNILRNLGELPDHGDAFDFVAAMSDTRYDMVDRDEALHRFIDQSVPAGPSLDVHTLIEDTIYGRREAIAWPWLILSEFTQALLPGTVTILCGKPGSGKSFMMLQSLLHWHENGYRVAVYELEERRDHHLVRVLAQLSGKGDLCQASWIKANPDIARDSQTKHRQILNSLGSRIWDVPGEDMSLEKLADWVKDRAQEGCRIIVIDPVTAAASQDKPWIADTKFINAVSRTASEFGASILLVTHPQKGMKGRPDQDFLAGGAAYSRLTQTVLWLEMRAQPAKVSVRTGGFGCQDMLSTHTLHISKARNGTGANQRLAFEFVNLRFVEKGAIQTKEAKDNG